MRGVNKVLLIGNATRDAQLRQTKSGKSVCSFGLATNRMVRSASGHEQETTQFHHVVCWDKLGEIAAKYVTKGKPLYVEGRLEYRTFEGPDGTTQGVAEVIASDVQFLGQRGAAEEAVIPDPTARTSAEPTAEEMAEEIPL